MKFVAVAACTSGIAHTYIAKEKLLSAAASLGWEAHVETQGTIGTESRLSGADIAAADFVLLAVDIQIGGRERFGDKRVVEIGTSTVIQSPTKLLRAIEQKLGE
ncbi:PTS fructose transporter subunit IIB [Streptomyces sp. NPDC004111]|uniref:PTS fructose transporter subunit IIB n=1 Tax=Streptomyces sp. NPDC004111 TaxID=3364690 RepID=UPI0036C6CB34